MNGRRRQKANRAEFVLRAELKTCRFSLSAQAVKRRHSCSFALRPISSRLTKRGLLKAISIFMYIEPIYQLAARLRGGGGLFTILRQGWGSRPLVADCCCSLVHFNGWNSNLPHSQQQQAAVASKQSSDLPTSASADIVCLLNLLLIKE